MKCKWATCPIQIHEEICRKTKKYTYSKPAKGCNSYTTTVKLPINGPPKTSLNPTVKLFSGKVSQSNSELLINSLGLVWQRYSIHRTLTRQICKPLTEASAISGFYWHLNCLSMIDYKFDWSIDLNYMWILGTRPTISAPTPPIKQYLSLPRNSSTTGCACSQVSWLYSKLLVCRTCCCVIAWIFCGIHTLTGDVMALVADEGLPFLEGVVSLLPLLPTLPTLPEGDGVGERGDGVPVILGGKHQVVVITLETPFFHKQGKVVIL